VWTRLTAGSWAGGEERKDPERRRKAGRDTFSRGSSIIPQAVCVDERLRLLHNRGRCLAGTALQAAAQSVTGAVILSMFIAPSGRLRVTGLAR
jgi:hypothetical protein